ncbi:MAG: FAD-dependent oxidoreductase [Planctomycetia bacterium]|nr:FAD-dependent oxidoreductase [Planctomycetia bacterium]
MTDVHTGPRAHATSLRPDVIVVGAGVIGVACAHYLATAGLRVTVIDQGTIGGACSGGNCGYICPSHVLPLTEPGAFGVAFKSLFTPDAPFRVKPRLDPALWNWMWQFARRCTHKQVLEVGVHLKAILDASIAEYRRLVRDEGLDCQWQETGLLYVLRTERGMRAFAETDKLLAGHFGVPAVRLDGTALPAFDPALKAGLAGAYHYPGDASLRPDLLMANWSQKLVTRGVRFIEHCRLERVNRADARVTGIETSQGPLTAERYVFALGGWSPRIAGELGCPIPIEQGKGYSVTMHRPDPCPRHPMLFPEHRIGVSPFEDGYRLGSMMEFAGYDESIPEKRIRQLHDSAKPYLITPSGPGPEKTWYGWRPMTWDSLPIIGQVPRLSNAFLSTGHNMLGMSLATATGKLVAEIMEGVSPHVDPAPFSPRRFL